MPSLLRKAIQFVFRPWVPRHQASRARVARGLVVFAFFASIVFIWSFAAEYRLINSQPVNSWREDATADCAVVLTGGPHRIREGVDLLGRKAVQKLIISGVHPQAKFRDIFPLWPFYGDLRESDIILERRSLTTYGNAQQTLPLIEALHCRDLILVTSRIHMRRALATFKAEFPPGFPIVSRAIFAGSSDTSFWEISYEVLKSLFYGVWAY
jgi:uncharacterized SAM-binding protein YcdF (DUF218 family)